MIRDRDGNPVDAAMVMRAYQVGCFPMCDDRAGRLAWYRPPTRAIITWDHLRCPRSLRKVMARRPYSIAFDQDFAAVIKACAQRSETWIGRDIEALFIELFTLGVAHSVAAFDQQGDLVGGCYGLALGGLFCGESMFHRRADASKICVWELLQHLRTRGFHALDCQQQSEHMRRFGAREISAAAYTQLLSEALAAPVTW